MTTANAGTPALLIEGLTKRYGDVEALRGIDVRVERGEVFGFLGPNGAGKSTTIRLILDLIRPTAGRIAVFGVDCQRAAVEARRSIGYLPSDPTYPNGMTAAEVFAYAAAVRRQPLDRPYVDGLVRRLQLDPTRHVRDLSRGNRQKVGLIQALSTRAPLLILDEPTTGLDPLVQEEVEGILRDVAAEGRTVFFSSHILAEVEAICSRATILRGGLVVDTFDLAEQRRLAPLRVEVILDRPLEDAATATLPASVRLLEHEGARLVFESHDEGMDGLVKWLARYHVERLISREPTLEDLFIRYYHAQDGAQDGPEGPPPVLAATERGAS
ncbi:MAG: ATP-binding cassette domain-containing protein [Dehalococcoidia bacterium]